MDLKDLQTTVETRLDGINQSLSAEIKQNNADLKAVFEQRLAEEKAKGVIDPETKEKLDRVIEKSDKLFARVDEMEAKLGAPGGGHQPQRQQKSTGESVVEHQKFKTWQERGFVDSFRERINVPGNSFFGGPDNGQKAVMTSASLGSGTSGVIMPMRIPDVIGLPRQEFRLRDLIPVVELNSGNSVDYLKQNVFTNAASPQTEGSAKAESTLTYTTASATVTTIAHFINVTRQALDDVPGLRADIDDMLLYGLKLKEESELLTGDGLGSHLNGIATQATAYSSGTYNVSGDTKLDKLRHFILQVRLALYSADGIVLNPRDLHDIDLLKDEDGGANKGHYIVGDPRTGSAQKFIWGKPVVESDSIAYGKALVGNFRFGARIYDRMQSVIDISFEHDENFTKNLATIRAEERLALAVLRPASFVYGSI